MKFHGIDLHTDSLINASLSIIDKGTSINTTKYYLTGESFEKFKKSLSKDDYVIVESCSNSFWLYDQIKNIVKECFILNTIKFKQNTNKTDKIDAKKLAKKLAYYVLANGDKDDLPMVYIPNKEIRELRGLFSSYKLNKKTMTQYSNRIHSILKQNGIYLEKKELTRLSFKNNIQDLNLSQSWKVQIIILLNQIELIEQQTEDLKRIIFQKGYDLFKNELELLLSITGFSPLTAIALMTDIADINRFHSVKKFCSYLRTTPRVKSSNTSTVIGRTNKEARSLTCSLLSQSINHFADASDFLNSFYQRVKQGKKAGVYRMALMRKILVCAFYMLKRKKKFYWVKDELYKNKLRDLSKEISTIVINKYFKKEEEIKKSA
jgi:transposase